MNIQRGNDTRLERLARVKEALANKNTRKGLIPEQIQKPAVRQSTHNRQPQLNQQKKIIQRSPQRSTVVDSTQVKLTYEVNQFITTNHNFYVGFGGMGDALLTLASCWNDPLAKVFFFANTSSLEFIKNLYVTFQVAAQVIPNIMGQGWANTLIKPILDSPRFQTSGHLADGLDYNDWRNVDKYKKRIVTHANWIEKFGQQPKTKKVVCLCPSGSIKDKNRQRFLSKEEHQKLVQRFLDLNYTVYTICTTQDMTTYHFSHPHAFSVSTDRLVNNSSAKQPLNLAGMLRIINSADIVISVDTWLKTYSLIAGIPTYVIKTRWHGISKPIGDDITDFVFLDPRIWPDIRLIDLEDLIN